MNKSISLINIEIKQSTIQGKGVFTSTEISCGDNIAYFEGQEIGQDTPYSLVLDGSRIEPTGELRYLNHSCNSNTHFIDRWLVASRNIVSGEELTIDYLAHDNMVYYPFTCQCGAKNCKGQL